MGSCDEIGRESFQSCGTGVPDKDCGCTCNTGNGGSSLPWMQIARNNAPYVADGILCAWWDAHGNREADGTYPVGPAAPRDGNVDPHDVGRAHRRDYSIPSEGTDGMMDGNRGPGRAQAGTGYVRAVEGVGGGGVPSDEMYRVLL